MWSLEQFSNIMHLVDQCISSYIFYRLQESSTDDAKCITSYTVRYWRSKLN